VAQLALAIGACNERIAAKARSVLCHVDDIIASSSSTPLTLQQAKAALRSHLEAIKVHAFSYASVHLPASIAS
jgi:hypothetical protein